jgi:hypothetical protein
MKMMFCLMLLSLAPGLVLAHGNLDCSNAQGLKLTLDVHRNPRNNADAFVDVDGIEAHFGGWAKLVEYSGPGTLLKGWTYKLDGNFPAQSILKVVVKKKICGRGACDDTAYATSVKLVNPSEEIYFNCH